MKNINLNQLGLVELKRNEFEIIEGGWMWCSKPIFYDHEKIVNFIKYATSEFLQGMGAALNAR